jgi:peptide/nickel transport system substrate-binding protein
VRWNAGESIELVAESTFFLGRPAIRRLMWRFTPDLQVAVSQLVADQADAREALVTPENVDRARAAPQLTLYTYRGSVYGYLGFNLSANGDTTRPHEIFRDREVRRALTMAVDRGALLRNVFGDFAQVPPGPMSQLWWIWDPEIRQLPYDTAQAARILSSRGWRDADGDGIRDRAGRPLSFHVLLPSSSGLRRQYARLLQEQFRMVGARMDIDEVDPGVMLQRAGAGRFDAILLTWSTDPAPGSGISQTWTRAGFRESNFLRYDNPAFDRLVERAASGAVTREQSKIAWRQAIDTINADAPAIFLFAPDNVAAIHSRVADVRIRPDSWWALVRTWRIPSDRLIDRDRVER